MSDEKPSMRWPLIWLAFAIYCVCWSVIDGFLDTEADRAEAMGFLPIGIVLVAAAWAYVRHRHKQREAWRQRRFIAWLRADNTPPPPPVDWDVFETELARQLAGDDSQPQ